MALRKRHPELVFEKKNQDLQRLPKYARVEKRPVPHPPTASPYVGSHVSKVVYVSTKTPFMSAAKRVQKLLKEAEKRAMSKVNLQNKSEKRRLEQLKESSATLQKEEVFLKATGRAIDKAMNVGKWFDEKEEYTTRVKTGSVLVVDDVVEDEQMKANLSRKEENSQQNTTEDTNAAPEAGTASERANRKINDTTASQLPSKERKKRRLADEDTDLPDSRTRWVKMVEIAVALK